LWNGLTTGALALVLVLSVRFFHTLESAAGAQAIAYWSLSGIWFYLLKKKAGLHLPPFFEVLFRRALLSAPFALGVFLGLHWLPPGWTGFFSALLLGLLLYFLALTIFDRSLLKKILS